MRCMHQANTKPVQISFAFTTLRPYLQTTSDLTYGGEGRRYVGSSGERGKEVEMSMRVVASLNVRDIVTASRGLLHFGKGRVYKRHTGLTWRATQGKS